MKRDLKMRDYQIPAVDFVRQSTLKKVLLSVACAGGKTEMSIQCIEDYLFANPKARVLVLAHSTNVLLSNFYERLKELNLSFNYSVTFEDDAPVHVCIPAAERKIKGNYDLVIIDEAHENYLATRVRRIIDNINTKKELLLTATPSKFIGNKEYDTYFIAANEISQQWYAKLKVELVASEYGWMGCYNNKDEINEKFEWSINDTEKTLENVLESLLNRIKNKHTPEEFNNPSFISKFKSWASTFSNKDVGKTLFLTKRTEQADITYKILKDKGVNVGVSHHKCDKDSLVVEDFKKGKYDVLIVVDRARLGYDDEKLMNVIDMSGTHNIDVIYQIFMRVVRGTPDQQKYYLKVTPKGLDNMALTDISVQGALMLTDKRFISSYNGRNFRTMTIPTVKNPGTGGTRCGGTGGGRTGGTGEVTLPEFTHDTINTFRDIIHDLDNPVSIYKATTMDEVRHIFGFIKKTPSKTLEQLLESATGNLAYAE